MACLADNLAAVVCHGSYHTPAPYQPLLDALQARGVDAYCPHLPTADLSKLNVGDAENPDFDRGPPEGGYPNGDDDASAILEVLEPLIVDQGKDVVLIGHSSGGWVATEVARPYLQAKVRRFRGLRGGIIGILYMGALIIPVGESVHSFFQPKDGSFITPPFMTFHVGTPFATSKLTPILADNTKQKHGANGLGTMVQPEKYLFNDLDAGSARKWASTLTASPVLTTELTNDAYSALNNSYLVLDRDLTLPKEYQEGMVAAQGAKTGDFIMYHSPSGHSPHLSWTEGLADTVMDYVRRIGYNCFGYE